MLTIEEHSREQWEILGLLTIIFLSKIDISYFQALYLILPIYYFFFFEENSPNILQIHCFELNFTLDNLYYVVLDDQVYV